MKSCETEATVYRPSSSVCSFVRTFICGMREDWIRNVFEVLGVPWERQRQFEMFTWCMIVVNSSSYHELCKETQQKRYTSEISSPLGLWSIKEKKSREKTKKKNTKVLGLGWGNINHSLHHGTLWSCIKRGWFKLMKVQSRWTTSVPTDHWSKEQQVCCYYLWRC